MDQSSARGGTFFAIIGLGLLASAAISVIHTQTFLAHAKHAGGTVVDLEERLGKDGSVYYPVVEFTADNGQTIHARSSVGSAPPSYAEGDAVTVDYSPTNPHDVYVDGFMDIWGIAAVTGAMGFVATLAGCAAWAGRWIASRRRRLAVDSDDHDARTIDQDNRAA